MAEVIVPHFSFPFTWSSHRGATRASVIEQDTDEEVMACVEAILLTAKGEREDLVDFGITPQEFIEGGIDSERLNDEVLAWEPRAELLFGEHDMEFIDNLFQDMLTINVEGPQDA